MDPLQAFRLDGQVVIVTGATSGLTSGMAERRWGRIVTIRSLYSRTGGRYVAAYAASKHALLRLTQVLAMELATKGVTANCVVPGWTDTDLVRTEAASVAAAQGYDANEAIRRFLRAQPPRPNGRVGGGSRAGRLHLQRRRGRHPRAGHQHRRPQPAVVTAAQRKDCE